MKISTVVRLVTTTALAYNLYQRANQMSVKKTPVNEEFVETLIVDGIAIDVYLLDHIDGNVMGGESNTVYHRINMSRKLWDSEYKQAILDHEIGHIVKEHKGSFFMGTFDLMKMELEADSYSVSQGNLDKLIKYRGKVFLGTCLEFKNYNNTCLGGLLYTKAKAILKKSK